VSRTSRTVLAAATVCAVVATAASVVASMKYADRLITAGGTAVQQASGGAPTGDVPPAAFVPKVVHASLPSTGFRYLGVYEGSNTTASEYAQIEQFAHTVGRQPNIVLYYSSWGEPFSIPYAQTALEHGATLLVDMDPTSTSCASIAAGRQDAFLRSYAQSVKVFGQPVIISFGHEMNGNWYPWGWTHTQPAVYVQAWRHIVDVFRRIGADNVTWLWTVNSVTPGDGPIAEYWPGASYVTWTAMDAYYYFTYSDFSEVFGPTLAAIRQITNKPILIGETGIGQVSGQAVNIPGLFAGTRRAGLLGFVWYDQAQDLGIYHQDWRLEGNRGAVAAFRAAAAIYLKKEVNPATGTPGQADGQDQYRFVW
jgi:mannan endo-1,4-beta-mannosidase